MRAQTRYYSTVSTSSVSKPSFSILSNLPPLEHERFAAHRELESRLKATMRGEVHFDLGSRALYAADASNYRQLPIGVVFRATPPTCRRRWPHCRATGARRPGAWRQAPAWPANACNVAVVFDYSRYMNSIDSIDPEAKTCPRAAGHRS